MKKLVNEDMTTLSKRDFIKMRKYSEKKFNSNKGFLRLLKYLEKNWFVRIREDSLWNEYHCFSDDLKHMAEQGFLCVGKINVDGKVHKFYKIGSGGLQYLYLRRINNLMIIITIGSLIIGLSSILITLLK